MKHFSAIHGWRHRRACLLLWCTLYTLLCLPPSRLYACDVCGCGTGNYSMGMLSQTEANFVGVRYRTMSFDSHLLYAEHLRTREVFRIAELWARYAPVERLAVTGSLPYQFNNQSIDGGSRQQHGVGDLLLLGQYALLAPESPECAEPGALAHRLTAGAGVKLPTGRYQFNESADSDGANANFQLGTGSTDLLLTGLYALSINDLSLSTEVYYRINTTNSRAYRFGNRLTGTLAVSYALTTGETVVVRPELGLYAEWSERDTRNASVIQETGGGMLAATVGAEVFMSRNIVLGATLSVPVSQELADGQIRTHDRLSMQCALLW